MTPKERRDAVIELRDWALELRDPERDEKLSERGVRLDRIRLLNAVASELEQP